MTFKTKKPLTVDERRQLLILIGEAQARGIVIPEIPKEALKGFEYKWPLDENGYFLPNDGGKKYKPYPEAENFLRSRARFSILRGGRGSGKSACGAQRALKKIMLGKSGAVIHPRFEDFKTSTWPEFKKWIPWEMVVPSQRHRKNPEWEPSKPFVMVFTNGVRVYCKGLKDADSARGPNINWLWYDEGGIDKTGEAWQIANASVRIGKDTEAWTTSTPKGKSHWIYKFFHSQEAITDEVKAAVLASGIDRPLVEEYTGTIFDNKDNLDPMFFASMLATYPTGFLRQQEINGEYADEGGQVGYRSWFNGKIVDAALDEWELEKWVRYWDMAATEKKVKNDPDEAVGTLVGTNKLKSVWAVEDQVACMFEWDALKALIKKTALRDGPYVKVVIEQEPGSGGKNQIAALVGEFKDDPDLAGYTIVGQRPIDRVIEASYWFAHASNGIMYLVKGLWNEKFLEQVDGFLSLIHDDRVTSCSGAVRALSPFKKWSKPKFLVLGEEQKDKTEDENSTSQ